MTTTRDDEASSKPGRARTVSGAEESEEAGSGVLMGRDVPSGEAVALPDAVRTRGVTVIGKTGTGKSTLLEQLLLADLREGTPAVVIDPHGRLASRVLSLAPPEAVDRLILLEPWPDRPFRLNLLDCPDPSNATALDRTVDHTVEVFKKLFDRAGEYLPRLERDLDAAIRTVIPNRGTLLDVLRVFGNPELRARYRAAVTADAVHEYWDFFERLGREAEQARQVEATVNRLYKLLAPQLIRHLVDTPTTTVPFDAVLRGDRMLLLSIPARDLTPARCDFLGALFLGALTDRIFAREAATTDPPRLHLYIDEYARFATPMTAELFPEGRKYGVGLTVAHQTLAQVTGEAIRAAERQVGALVLFQLIGPDAEELAGELDTTPVRTKTTLQQRTESTYREWDEPVWDDPADERAYKEANEELPEVRQQLADLERLMYNLQEGLEADRYPELVGRVTLDELAKATGDSERFHLPFNPRSTYYLLNNPGHPEQYRPSRGFVNHYELSYWTTLWAEDEPHEWDKVTCEGYRLDISALQHCPLMAELSFTKRLVLQSNTSMDCRADAGYVKRLTELIAEVEELLTPLYTDAIFWFKPGPRADMPDIFPKYSPGPLDKRDPNDPFWRRFRADAPAEGAERREPCWMQYGRWITTPRCRRPWPG